MSDKSRLITLVLCLVVGMFGVHRFYVGKVGTGILQIVTFGGLGIWWIADVIMILLGGFTDGAGRPVKIWEN